MGRSKFPCSQTVLLPTMLLLWLLGDDRDSNLCQAWAYLCLHSAPIRFNPQRVDWGPVTGRFHGTCGDVASFASPRPGTFSMLPVVTGSDGNEGCSQSQSSKPLIHGKPVVSRVSCTVEGGVDSHFCGFCSRGRWHVRLISPPPQHHLRG